MPCWRRECVQEQPPPGTTPAPAIVSVEESALCQYTISVCVHEICDSQANVVQTPTPTPTPQAASVAFDTAVWSAVVGDRSDAMSWLDTPYLATGINVPASQFQEK